MQSEWVLDCDLHTPRLFVSLVHFACPNQNNLPPVTFEPADKTFGPDGAEMVGPAPEGGDEQGFQVLPFLFNSFDQGAAIK